MPPSSHHQLWPHKHSLQLTSHQAKSFSEYPQTQVASRSAFTAPEPEQKTGQSHPGDVYWVAIAVLSAICLIGFFSAIAWLVLRNRMNRSHSDWYIVTTGKDLQVIKEPILAPVSTIPAQKIAEKVTESSTNQVNLVTSHTAQHSQGQNINHSDLVGYRNGSRNRRRSIVSDDMTDSSTSTTELKIDLPVDEHSHQHAQPTPIDSSVKHAPKIIIAQRNDSQAEVPHVANEPNEPTNDIDFLVRLYQLLPRLPSQAVVPSAHDLRPSSLRRSCTVPAHFSGVCHLDRDKPAGLVSPGQISTDERESITSTLLQMLIESKDPNEPYLMDESLPPPSIIVSPPTGSTLSLQRKSEIFY